MTERLSTKVSLFASGDKDADGVYYKDGRLLSGHNRKLTEYSVAEGTEVICDRAFMSAGMLRSLVLPSSIRAIGESAFSGCKSLCDFTIPEGVAEIRQGTFRDTDALIALELPASVTEVEKFAFGRALETLVVNSPDVKFDKYAFANVKNFKMLIVPAGTAELYRSQLYDIRVKAAVEEMEECLNNIDMEEEKKMKQVTVEVFGYERFLEPKDANDDEIYDAYSRFILNNMVFTVDEEKYTPSDFSIDYDLYGEYTALNVADFFEESGAEEGFLVKNNRKVSQILF